LIITDEQIEAFALGLIIGALVTWWIETRERRIVSNIRSRIETIGLFCDLTNAQARSLIGPCHWLACDEEIISLYHWGRKVRRSGIKVDPKRLVALVIICEKLLGLSRTDAVKAMQQAKALKDYKTLLPSHNPKIHPQPLPDLSGRRE
jgi:hypothetical protein